MIVFLNGQFVSEEEAKVSVFDRGLLYGDGLFETIRVYHGRPFRWQQHWERMQRGAEFLKIHLSSSSLQIRSHVEKLVELNKASDAVLRLNLSRGIGSRGYSIRGAKRPTLVISLHPASVAKVERPIRLKLVTASIRISPDDPLLRFKTSNKLHQVLARAEAEDAGADEALLLNTNDHVTEAASGNLFWILGKSVRTAPTDCGALPGITREVVFEICQSLQLPCEEKRVGIEELFSASGVFLTSSVGEVAEVIDLNGRKLNRSPITKRILDAYQALTLEAEEWPA